MKYFTKEWHNGKISDRKSSALAETYKEYIDKNVHRLPFSIRLLAKSISLHDGIIKYININSKNKTLEFLVSCGNLQIGYYEITILFKSASYNQKQIDELKQQQYEILYNEWEITDKGYNFKILFYPYFEISIDLSDLDIKIANINEEERNKVHKIKGSKIIYSDQ